MNVTYELEMGDDGILRMAFIGDQDQESILTMRWIVIHREQDGLSPNR